MNYSAVYERSNTITQTENTSAVLFFHKSEARKSCGDHIKAFPSDASVAWRVELKPGRKSSY